ncbi:MAG: glycosyltransferase, exosortase A system-associated [Burkholderiaceae bacterium]|jgi:PEP-CTERM/exosortase A-associated glycosyltransferase|nr:glycosyltransferase, exosortase A system-associated [Burkholderiaceae bacterium]
MTEKILHVLDHSIPLHSGYAFRSRSIILAQRELGWRTVHLTSAKHAGFARGGSPLSRETIDGLVFHRTFPGGLARFPVLRQWDVVRTLAKRIVAVARSERVDILHAHSPSLNGLAALQAGRELDLPVVYEVRALWEDAAVDHGTSRPGGLRYRLSRALETHVVLKADAVTCICEGLRSEIVARGVEAQRVMVIPNAVDIEQFPPIGERNRALEAEYDLRGKQVLGFIGSFYGYEGLDLLIAALPAILRERPNTRLLLVGGGPQEGALRAQAAKLGVAGQVIFTGRVPHGRVPLYSSLVDVFVFPRKPMRLTELVTPLKPLEAMAQRRLVLASDVGGHRELIEHGKTGLLFRHSSVGSLADATSNALARFGTLDGMLDRARAFVEGERTWRASVERYRDVYRQARAAKGVGTDPGADPEATMQPADESLIGPSGSAKT